MKLNVTELAGNWVAVFTNQGQDSYRWIIQFTKDDDGKFTAKIIENRQKDEQDDKPEIFETEVNGDAIRLGFKIGTGVFDFVGSFQEGFIRGTTQLSPSELFLTRFLPTEETSLEAFQVTGRPPGADIFEARMKSKDVKLAEFAAVLRDFRTSPLTQEMYGMLMRGHVEANFDEGKLIEVINDYLASAKLWGDRWESRAEISIATNLINLRRFVHLAPAHLDAAEQKMGSEKPQMQASLKPFRDAANALIRVQEIQSTTTTDEVKAAAASELTELLKIQKYNAEILYAVANHAEKTGKTDVAFEYLSEIVALPLLELTIHQLRRGDPPDGRLPGEMLKRLWTEKHGSEAGYEQYIAEVYSKKIDELITQMQQSAPLDPALSTGSKAVLVELFTGLQCTQCVAADLSLAAISKTYSQSKAIVIRYHQHIPFPDGLVNQDSEEMAMFYEVNSIPAVFVDGIKIDPRFYIGQMQFSENAFDAFRKIVDSRLAEKTEAVVQLSAAINNGQLEISAEATGVPPEILPTCRLRLAIVENRVEAFLPLATNGIREQELLVRELPGGAKGVAPKNGELKYSSTMPVADLQEHVTGYISRFEAGRQLEFPPQVKPPICGPLSVVAWVQNGNPDPQLGARCIIQATIVPVTGTSGFEVTKTTDTTNAKSVEPDKTTASELKPVDATNDSPKDEKPKTSDNPN